MAKTRIVLLVVGIAAIALMYLLPKAVVEDESQLKEEATTAPASTANAAHSNVPATLSAAIKATLTKYRQGADNQKNAIFADSLRILYNRAGQFDSAAWFAERAATFFNSEESFLKAGNSYYEAYTFAVDATKQEKLAELTRKWLEKALEANPKNLEAKTKIGMTYFSSNPPKGVGILREVLAVDPKNELVLFNMGMLAIQSQQYSRAVERLKELVAVNEKHVQGQLLLGVAYLNLNQEDKAREQFEKVKKLDNDPAVLATVDSYLKDLK